MPAYPRSSVFWLFLCLFWALPYLAEPHTLPIATFYTEWLSALLLWLACLVWLWQRRQPAHPSAYRGAYTAEEKRWPVAWLLPASLCLIFVGQYLWPPGQATHLQWLGLAYGLAGWVSVWLATQVRRAYGVEQVVLALAWAMLVASIMGSTIELIQAFRLEAWLSPLVSEVVQAAPRRLFGNMNQPNHQATMVAMGLAAGGYLLAIRKMPVAVWWGAVLLQLLGLVLTGSRTAWIHVWLCTGLGVLLCWHPRAHQGAWRRGMQGLTSLSLPFLFYAMYQMVSWASQVWQLDLFNTLAKMQQGEQIGARGVIWQHAWLMFRLHPWFGVGWGDFAWQQFQQLEQIGRTVELANNAHNIVLDVLAKTGFAGGLLLGGALLFWLWRMVCRLGKPGEWQARGGELVLPLVWLAMLMAHSMLEYPLHYLFFWNAWCFLLALCDAGCLNGGFWYRRGCLGERSPGRLFKSLLSGLFWLSVGAALLVSLRDYQRAEALYYGDAAKAYQQPPEWLFREYAAFGYTGIVPLQHDVLPRTLALHEAALHLAPQPILVRRTALLWAMQGKTQAALALVRPLRWYYGSSLQSEGEALAQLCRQLAEAERPKLFCQTVQTWQQKNPENEGR